MLPGMKRPLPRNQAGTQYALELFKQVVNLNQGLYLEEDIKNGGKTDFCIGMAGYPDILNLPIWQRT